MVHSPNDNKGHNMNKFNNFRKMKKNILSYLAQSKIGGQNNNCM